MADTLGQEATENGLLHVSFRRENPTVLLRDFVIEGGLRGPGRFLGCNVGIRILPDPDFSWYGEGEVKVDLDGRDAHPTWCGTGLEDYVGTAWGMGAHTTSLQGVPLVLQPEPCRHARVRQLLSLAPARSDRVSARLPCDDPADRCGGRAEGTFEIRERLDREGRVAGEGWYALPEAGPLESFAVCERQDDYCATAFVYCRDAQPVPRLALASIVKHIVDAHKGKIELSSDS